MASSSPAPPWSEILEDILALVIDRLGTTPADQHRRRRFSFTKLWYRILRRDVPFDRHGFEALRHARQRSLPADRARFRAVCRSWRLAMRHHGAAAPRLLPWAVFSDGTFSTPSDDDDTEPRRLPTLLDGATCIGSTDDWLALDCADDEKEVHTYFLHNPFSDTTVPLPELNAVIGNLSELFKVRKVLMRSGPHDVIALLTNNWNYPVILVRPGKGMWLPEPKSAPFIYIMDIAFLGDKLYGITHTKDLVSLGIGFDSDGVPNVTSIERLIRPPPSRIYRLHVWRGDDDDADNTDANNNEEANTDDAEFEFEYHNEELTQEVYEEQRALDELRNKTGDDMVLEGIIYQKDTEVPYELHDRVAIIWYLMESRGKLLMVRRHLVVFSEGMRCTRKVKVFEANVKKGVWVPVSDGLCGQALFISKRLCKSIYAHGDVEEDTIYFADTGEAFDIKSQTMTRPQREVDHWQSMWMFSPDLVV